MNKLTDEEERILIKKLTSRRHSMLDRCYNHNAPKYKNYGARGVSVCSRWVNSKDDFINDAKLLPGYNAKDIISGGMLQLDKDIRIPGSMHYGPDTCSWVTPGQNDQIKPSYMWWHHAYNLKTNTLVKFYSIEHFCKVSGLTPKSVSAVSHSENKNRDNTGWLNGWYFWPKGRESDKTMKLFVATNPEGKKTTDYKVGRLADTIGIPRKDAYNLTSKAKTQYTVYRGYRIDTYMLSEKDLESVAIRDSDIK